MPDYIAAAERAARKYGIDPAIFKAQIRQESGFDPNARSPAGAQGIAQFMPGTARQYGVNLGDNRVTDDLDGAARYMADALKRTGGDYHQALSIYNSGRPDGYKHIAETRNYVTTILRAAGNHAPRGRGASTGDSTTTRTVSSPGVDNSGARRQALASFLLGQSTDPITGQQAGGDILDLALQMRALKDVPGTSTTTTSRTSGATSSSGGGDLASKATARANVLDAKHMPYLWGGGHQGRIIHPENAAPLDCSGAVSAVLGINPRVSGQFTKWGRSGDGGNRGVTIYANDHHVLMKINGHFFGTSATNPGGGAGWIPQSAISADYLKGFTVRHSAG